MKIGYVRIQKYNFLSKSEIDSFLKEQAYFASFGCEKLFKDFEIQLYGLNMPGFQEIFLTAQPGDSILVKSFSNFCKNFKELLEIVEYLAEKEITLQCLSSGIVISPSDKTYLSFLKELNKIEVEYVRGNLAQNAKRNAQKGKISEIYKRNEKLKDMILEMRNQNIIRTVIQEKLKIKPSRYTNLVRALRNEGRL
jgi:DNA invertase Pin-like site-specific DNA recombinase